MSPVAAGIAVAFLSAAADAWRALEAAATVAAPAVNFRKSRRVRFDMLRLLLLARLSVGMPISAGKSNSKLLRRVLAMPDLDATVERRTQRRTRERGLEHGGQAAGPGLDLLRQ